MIIHTIGKPFTELAVVDSTNNYAMAAARNGTATHGAAWFAHRQTQGKGSRGKSWDTGTNETIALSVLLNPGGLLPSQSFYLTAAVALATYDLLLTYAIDNVSVKWPNDIYWRDRKAVGMLIENSFRGSLWQWSVAGIGVNINQSSFSPALRNPVSLRQITGRTYSTVELAKELCGNLQHRYEQLMDDKESILSQYNDVLYRKDQLVTLRKDNVVFTATIRGADASGLLHTEGGIQPQFTFGEIEWLLPENNTL